MSYSGRNKISSASLTAKQKYQYTITFKFTDYISEDTKNLDVKVNLIKAQMITKTDIENMMKSVKNSDGAFGSKNNGEILFLMAEQLHLILRAPLSLVLLLIFLQLELQQPLQA